MLNLDIEKKILKFLQSNYPKDFNIQEIANEIKTHRNTVSTYLKVLVAEKKIIITRKMGKINLFSILKNNN